PDRRAGRGRSHVDRGTHSRGARGLDRGPADRTHACQHDLVSDPGVQDAVASVFRDESARVLATLIRLLGDFDLAEEALQDAFAAAVEQWGASGVPANP